MRKLHPGQQSTAANVRLADRKIEVVTSLKGLSDYKEHTGGGVAPNDFLLLTRDMETQEIYALNLKGLLSDLRHTYL
jgi:hypothetical protein